MLSNARIAELKEIYANNLPFFEMIYFGDVKQHYFSDLFIEKIQRAFSTDCIVQFTNEEYVLFVNFLAYQDGTYTDTIVQALDVWLTNIINEIPNPMKECN